MPTTMTATLKNGECITLPKGATIQTIIADGTITPSGTCNIPPTTQYGCYRFIFAVNDDADDSHPAGIIDILGFRINGVDYPVPFPAFTGFNDMPNLSTYFNSLIPNMNSVLPLTIRVVSFTRINSFEKRAEYSLLIKLAPIFASSTFVLFNAEGFEDEVPVLLQPVAIACPPPPST
jgi:hypothetical protein